MRLPIPWSARSNQSAFGRTATRFITIALIALLAATGTRPATADDGAWERFRAGEAVLMVRHALAPGTGDPANFAVRDCSTQRNLSDEGRAQSRAMGEWLKARGVSQAAVYSSQWCRCLETARLMSVGEVKEFTALNSFFQMPENREASVSELQQFLRTRKPEGKPVILVTHQVTITAITGKWTRSGEGYLVDVDASGRITVAGSVDFRD